MTDVRLISQKILAQWDPGGRFASSLLEQAGEAHGLDSRDRAFLHSLVFGVLRNLTLLDHWIDILRNRGSLKQPVRWLLRQAVFEVVLMHTAGHAAVFQNVRLARRYEKGIVNALLRRALDERDSLRALAELLPLPVRFSLPSFLIDRWQSRFGAEATLALCQSVNEPASPAIRANLLKFRSAETLVSEFGASPIPGHPGFFSCPALPYEAIQQGLCYVQDPGTAAACRLLDPRPGDSVLDACAAPGGKSGIIAEFMENAGELVCVDRHSGRARMVNDNLTRLGVAHFTTIVHDWFSEAPPDGLRNRAFDKILVDAPCSNTGVLRRRVDVRWRLTSPEVFETMQKTQIAIVESVLQLLKPGGTLVYSTCSIEPEENEVVVERLAGKHGLFVRAHSLTLPQVRGSDGAFSAALVKAAKVQTGSEGLPAGLGDTGDHPV